MPNIDPRIFPLSDAAANAASIEALSRDLARLSRQGSARNQYDEALGEATSGDTSGPTVRVDVSAGSLVIYYVEAEIINGSVMVEFTGTMDATSTLLSTTSATFALASTPNPRVVMTPPGSVTLTMRYSGVNFRNRKLWAMAV